MRVRAKTLWRAVVSRRFAVCAFAVGCTRVAAVAPREATSTPTSAAAERQDEAVRSVVERVHFAHGIEYVVRASRLTNLTWQLDCLAGLARCSRPAYDALWSEPLAGAPELRTALERWGELRRASRGPVGEALAANRSGLPLPRRNADLFQRVRFAGTVAANPREYELLLHTLTDAATAHGLTSVLDAFEPTFNAIWKAALPELERAIQEHASAQTGAEVTLAIQRAIAFYGAELGPRPRVTFEMLFRPKDDSPTYATQVLDRSLVEVVPTEAPELRILVPVHELFHHFFANAPHAKLEELAHRFATSPEPNALPAYGLLDEVLATGLAQGVLGRRLAAAEFTEKLGRPSGLYADRFVDAVAKALLAELDRLAASPEAGTVFSARFQLAYLDAVRRAFPRGLPPIAHLRPLACAYSKELEAAYRQLHTASGAQLVGSTDAPHSEDARALLEDRPTWGRVLLLRSDAVGALQRYRSTLSNAGVLEIARAARTSSSFAYASRKQRAGAVFVLVADDAAHAERLVASFAELDAMFAGVSLATPRGVGPQR